MRIRSLSLQAVRDVVRARQLAREEAQRLGFGLANQTRLATAVSEIARNAISHGGGGEMTLEVESNGQTTLTVTVSDHGPGIADVALALTNGWSSGDGLGAGLPGARRLVHAFNIRSAPGQGTTVTMSMTA